MCIYALFAERSYANAAFRDQATTYIGHMYLIRVRKKLIRQVGHMEECPPLSFPLPQPK